MRPGELTPVDYTQPAITPTSDSAGLLDEPSIVVLGLGNLLYGDEGFGVHALHQLQAQYPPNAPIGWIDGGVAGLDLLPLVESCTCLLVLDAVDAGLAPGSLCELHGEQLLRSTGLHLSEHQVSFQDVLGLAYIRGNLPSQLRLLGAQPARLATCAELSPALQAALEQLVPRAEAIIEDFGNISIIRGNGTGIKQG